MTTDQQAPTPRWTPSMFERERRTYEERKAELLLRDEGKFVVIRADVVLGPFEAREEALSAGYERFGLVPLYTKEIREVDEVVTITRDILPCQS